MKTRILVFAVTGVLVFTLSVGASGKKEKQEEQSRQEIEILCDQYCDAYKNCSDRKHKDLPFLIKVKLLSVKLLLRLKNSNTTFYLIDGFVQLIVQFVYRLHGFAYLVNSD